MLTLYTAIGTLKFVKNTNGKSTPMVLNNHQEFGLCDHELILWSCLAFQILQIHELESGQINLSNRFLKLISNLLKNSCEFPYIIGLWWQICNIRFPCAHKFVFIYTEAIFFPIGCVNKSHRNI